MIAGVECSVHFLLHSTATQLHIHGHIPFSHSIMYIQYLRINSYRKE